MRRQPLRRLALSLGAASLLGPTVLNVAPADPPRAEAAPLRAASPGVVERGTLTTFVAAPSVTAVVNLTATETLEAGYFQMLSAGDRVGAFSNLNSDHAGQTVAGLSLVKTDAEGNATIYSSGGGHEIVDLQGYMASAAFEDVPDERILDTRVSASTPLAAGTLTEIRGTAGKTGVVNLVATDVSIPGYVQVLGSATQPVGGYSNLNADRVGQIINRLAFVRFNAEGKAFLYTQGSMHLVADLQGYMQPGAFDDISDLRVLDTRVGAIPAAGSQTVINGRPDSTGVISIVATEAQGPGYIQVLSPGDQIGAFSNLNVERVGQTVGSLAFVRFDSNGQARIYSFSPAHLVVDVQGYMGAGAFNDVADQRLLDTRPPPGQSKIRVLSLDYIPLIDRGGSMRDWPLDTMQTRQRLGVTSPSSAPIDDLYSEYNFSYSQVRSRIDEREPVVAETLERGSRYHGSRDPTAVAALDYEVVHRAEFLEPIPLSSTKSYGGNPIPDYLQLLSDLDICAWIDGEGVREVWIWAYQGAGISPWESNLSFAGGDFSNSDQDPTDLPLCAHSYTVYNYNFGREVQQAVHNHMHQFERIFALINNGRPFSRFWSSASCGTTHRPPNSDRDYQYDSTRAALSDCENWSMAGSRPAEEVSAETWSRAVPSGDPELGFYVWWMQSIPGLRNSASSANWWALIADLDEAFPRRKQF